MLAHERRASIPGDRFIQRRSMRDSLRVVDVYDSAAAIGKDFELLIDKFGAEAIQTLMPKVIGVLEDLETLATKNEEEIATIGNLQMAVSRLEAEKLARAEERSRYECELEQIEETWRSESEGMLQMIDKLREENHRLLADLEEQRQARTEPAAPSTPPPTVHDDHIKLIAQLKATINDQRDQIRALKRDVQQRGVDVDALQQQSEALARLNADLRRRQNVSQRQAEHLLDEKSTLEADLTAKEQLLRQMRECVHSESSESDGAPTSPGGVSMSEDEFVDKLNAEGKMIIDTRDPERPRFTLQELRDVLKERNELKTRLIEVEEELKSFKPDCEAPVQGPINREPDEKLRPQRYPQEFGIKHFFQRLMERIHE